MLNLIGSFVLLLTIRWELAIIVFIMLPLIFFIVYTSRKNLTQTSTKVKETTAEVNAGLESSISGIRVTKGFCNEDFERERFAVYNKQYSAAKQGRFRYMASFFSNIEFCNNLLSLLTIAVGGYFIMQGKMTLPDLVAANLFVASFVGPIKRLNGFVEQFATGMAGFNRFIELMNTETEPADAPNAVEILSARGNISFKNVDFSYTPDFPILQNVNLEIHSGEKFALVGTSGGGKTTICNLIPRFYEITGVSIARCFLKNPPILILDEATSALDTATEIKIQHAFDELSRGRTTLVIAHHLSTIKNADKIAVVNDHGIVELGTHDELMAKHGEYYKLQSAQVTVQ